MISSLTVIIVGGLKSYLKKCRKIDQIPQPTEELAFYYHVKLESSKYDEIVINHGIIFARILKRKLNSIIEDNKSWTR